MERGRILVVDDKENILKLLDRILRPSHDVKLAENGAIALSMLAAERFDVVISDIRMPGADGFEVLRAVRRRDDDTEVILMTAYGAIERAVEAMKLGAYDYLTKPFDPDEVVLTVARALEQGRLKRSAALVRGPAAPGQRFGRLVGQSEPMREVHALIERAAASDITVLLNGDTGTGKELVAREIHERSARGAGAFVPLNCGALPGELVESELFGYAKGAFTGANVARPGLFEAADKGTLFLDEIAELPLPVQVKLNRVLQEREIRRVGDQASTRVDVRLIAATHRQLKLEVQAGRFREDLYYRLYVMPIRLPKLRERQGDIRLLAAHFLAVHSAAQRRAVDGFEPAALSALEGYAWPGNVRELQNSIERAVAVARGPKIRRADLPEELGAPATERVAPNLLVTLPFREAVERARDAASRDYIVALMREFKGNVSRAAERAGMERESLHRLLRRYSVRSDEFKREATKPHETQDPDE
ncbi:MAG: sigma-54-dependent Fis family transcriptional regulator [Deltaproteobacteria bacterium]|nr:sigma-54-dependent Fis family transcriptional regulator [Deltaproteobacteria bacterium]